MAERPVALVTGAAGFAGHHLIQELERETEWRILGVARKQYSVHGQTRIITADLRSADLVDRVIQRYKPDYIFHLAAQSYVPQAFAQPAETIANNVTSQINLLEACRNAQIEPMILIVGSSEEYGQASPCEMPLSEDQPFRPGNPYAVSKIAQDMLGYQYALSYGMNIVRVRPFNHFGPGQSDRFVLANFSRQVAEAEASLIEPTVLTGNTDVVRDFTDVRDIVRGYRFALEMGKPGEVYNLSSDTGQRVQSLLDTLISMSAIPLETRVDPSRFRVSDTPVVVGDSSKFRRDSGWSPSRDIETSLADTLQYWRSVINSPGYVPIANNL